MTNLRVPSNRLLLSAVLLLAIQLATPASAASFDCTKARTNTEKMICADASLSELDSKLGSAYEKALHASPDPQSVRSQELKWMRDVRNQCTTPDCLRAAYLARLQALGATAQIEAPTNQPPHGSSALTPGKYCQANGELDLTKGADGKLNMDLSAQHVIDAAAGNVNTGEIQGVLESTPTGEQYINKELNCEINIRSNSRGLLVTQHGDCGFGLGVIADGLYSRGKCNASASTPAAATSGPAAGKTIIDADFEKYHSRVEALGIDKNFLGGQVYLQEDLVNGPQKFSTLEKLLVVIMSNPKVEKLETISLEKTEGFTVKVKGRRTFGVLFINDDGDLFPQYLATDAGKAVPLTGTRDQYEVTQLLLDLIPH